MPAVSALADDDLEFAQIRDLGERRCMPDVRPSALLPVDEQAEPGPGSLRFRDTNGTRQDALKDHTAFGLDSGSGEAVVYAGTGR